MRKRIVAILMAAVICAGSTVPALAGEFSDVRDTAWYADAVTWAVGRGITTGTGNTEFSPFDICTQAQILTFLWRYENYPEPTVAYPFSTMTPSDYYYKAVLWAYERKLIIETDFEADAPCTRSMAVMYLWKLSGSPFTNVSFEISDVPVTADYAQAVAWALEKDITAGVQFHRFDPDGRCTRAEIVTFLHRFDSLPVDAGVSAPADIPTIPDSTATPSSEPQEPKPLSIGTSISKSASIVGSMYSIRFSLSANATGGAGDYSYKFEVLQNDEVTESTGWTSNNTISGTLSGNGTCVVEITVKDSEGETESTTVDLLKSSHSSW